MCGRMILATRFTHYHAAMIHPANGVIGGGQGAPRGLVRRTLGRLALDIWVWGVAASNATASDRAPSSPRDPAARSESHQRLVIIGPSTAEVVCALGACDRVVGVDRFTIFPPELDDLPRVGGLFDPDLERIIALQPDLVILRGRNSDLERLCEQSSIELFLDQTDSLATLRELMAQLGTKLNREVRARALIDELNARLDRIQARSVGLSAPRVLMTISRRPGTFSNVLTAGKGSFLTEVVELAGGRNVFEDVPLAYPQVSPESMLATQPEVIVEFLPGETWGEPQRDALLREWEGLGSSPATRAGRVHVINEDHALIPSPRIVDVVDRLSRLLHPEPHDHATDRSPSDAERSAVRLPGP